DRGRAALARRRGRRLVAGDGGTTPRLGAAPHQAERGPGEPTRRNRIRGAPGRGALARVAGSAPADRRTGAADSGATNGVAQASRRRGLALHLARAVLAIVDRRQVGEVPLHARRELVRLVVPDDAKARLPPGALATPTRVDAEPLTQPRPLGGRD